MTAMGMLATATEPNATPLAAMREFVPETAAPQAGIQGTGPTVSPRAPSDLVPVLPDILWCDAAAAAALPAAVDASLFSACLDSPEKLSVPYKTRVPPVVPPLLQHTQDLPDKRQHLQALQATHQLLRIRGVVTRKQSLGRRLCFFDLMQQHTKTTAAAAVTTVDAGAIPAEKRADSDAEFESILPGMALAHPPAAAEVCPPSVKYAAICCSVCSSDLGGLDVHRCVSRKICLGDFVEAVGLLERKADLSHLSQIKQQLVTRSIGFKVLALRALRSVEQGAGAAAAAAAAQRVKLQSRLLTHRPEAPSASAEAGIGQATSGTDGEAADEITTALISRICKMYLVSGSCRRLACPLMHIKDGRMRRHFDILKAQRQVRSVQRQLLLPQQHPQVLQPPLPHLPDHVSTVPSSSAITLQCSSCPPPDCRQPEQQIYSPQRIYPRSIRGAVFAEWLISTYGAERLSKGSGVIEVAGGRGELAFELTVKYNVPVTIIDPRCTYTTKSLAVQPQDARKEWEQLSWGLPECSEEQDATAGIPGVRSTCFRGVLSSAMSSGSRRSLECPLRLSRRQANWMLREKGLKRKEAQEFFVSSVETIPAMFDGTLLSRSPYVREKLLKASAIVGLHPDEATGDLLQTGLIVREIRHRWSHNERSITDSMRSINSIAKTMEEHVQQQQKRQSEEQKQHGDASEELPDVALAVVPCCVFSEKFPHRLVPLTAAEAANVSPAAAAAAAAAVFDTTVGTASLEKEIKDSTAEGQREAQAHVCNTAGIDTIASEVLAARGETPAVDASQLCGNDAEVQPFLVSPSQSCRSGVHLFMAEAESSGQVRVRTYEELLLWLHLSDPRRRLHQQTLPLVGKNQVVFLPP
ncbi:uncharacterized protein LOC34624558 [Cyclospora cayetanensis]|uniref:Uncharacterized protein LOC34624558 n=1 Tax=Cyclospora cayetanensis TaxID=88456 RepID=A0A6P6S1E8_9EIME|nr:uncharacterized protein LOC34624558 [Cyclospora cayetanensis]